jgi:hypothetical protein
MRRTPFRSGNWAASNSALIDAKAEWSEIGVTRDRLRRLECRTPPGALRCRVAAYVW